VISVETKRRISRHTIVGAIVLLCSLFLLAPSALAQGRAADAKAPSPVAYHLTVLVAQGRHAGTTVEGQVSGTLDSTGILTATLTATNGATATVMGTLSTAGMTVSVQGKAGMFDLRGAYAHGRYSGTVGPAGGEMIGAWILAPELTARTYTFQGRVANGRYRGFDLGGALSIALQSNGRYDGRLTLDDGTILVAEGRLLYNNLDVTVQVPGKGVIRGVAPVSQRTFPGDASPTTLYVGTFIGPGTGDRGAWGASLSS